MTKPNEQTAPGEGVAEPEIVAHLRERLAVCDAEGRVDDEPCALMVGPRATGLGIRPRLVSDTVRGKKVYSLTVAQARKLVASFDATTQPKDQTP